MIRMEVAAREDGRTVKLTRKCVDCGEDVSMFVRPEDAEQFRAGAGYVQDIFPYLTPAERELLISGACGPCFAKMFPPDEEGEA